MLVGSREHEEWFLLNIDHNLCLIAKAALKVIDLAFAKNKYLGFDCSLLECDSFGHIFDVLDNKVNWNAIISKAGNDDIGIDSSGKDEVSKGVLHEFVVLLQYTNHTPSSLSSIPSESTAKSDIV